MKCDRHTRYTILLVGAFDSNKGQMELLQAVKRIVAEGKDILCYLVGPDVGFMPKCQKYIQDNGLDNNVKLSLTRNRWFLIMLWLTLCWFVPLLKLLVGLL